MSITLSNYIDSIRKLYYTNGQGSLFTYKVIRKQAYYLLLLLLVVGAFWFVATKNNDYIFPVFIGTIAVPIYLSVIILQAFKYQKWKNTIELYVSGFKEFDTCDLILNENSFELKKAERSLFEKWTDLKEVKFFPDHISFLNGSGSAYIFPAESMTPPEFQVLSDLIKDRIK